MIRAIRESAKLDKASKKEKEKQFKAANEATKKTLSPELRVKLLASIESTDFDELEDAIEK
jgi:GTP-binding protein EngB required for normal cell division